MDWNTIFLYFGLVVVFYFNLYSIITIPVFFVFRLILFFYRPLNLYNSYFFISFIPLIIIDGVWKKFSGHHLPFFAVLFMVSFLLSHSYISRYELTEASQRMINAEISSIVLYALYIFIFVEFNWA